MDVMLRYVAICMYRYRYTCTRNSETAGPPNPTSLERPRFWTGFLGSAFVGFSMSNLFRSLNRKAKLRRPPAREVRTSTSVSRKVEA